MQIIKLHKDQNLIDRIRENDRDVLHEIYLKYERLVTKQITKMGGDSFVASDMLQEAVIVLWERAKMDGFELKSKLSTFLVSIAKNAYLNEIRKQKKMVLGADKIDIPDTKPTSLEEIIEAEKAELVMQAMEQLQEVCRRILILFYYEQFSLSRIAELMQFANEQVAKSKKYQCKKALKDLLKKNRILKEES